LVIAGKTKNKRTCGQDPREEGEEKGRLIPSEVIGTGRDNEIKFRAGLYIGRVESRQDFLILDLLYFTK